MLVTRRNQDFMPTLFNELMNWNDTTYSTPRMNIMETKDNYKLELCIPGLTKEDVKLSIDAEGNLLTLTKYNTDTKYGAVDSLVTLQPVDDALPDLLHPALLVRLQAVEQLLDVVHLLAELGFEGHSFLPAEVATIFAALGTP